MSDAGKWSSEVRTGTYEETVFSKWMTLLLGSITTIFLLIWSYDIFVGWSWSDPLLRWFWLGMFLFFLAFTANFSKLKIKINTQGLTVGYGIARKKIPWERVEDCHIDEKSALRYGGWGIRFTRVSGKWRTAYNVVGGSRVVVSLNEGLIREVAFSTKNPEEVKEVIESNLRKRGKAISDT
ncbi:MAG: hypothetical protein V5A66_06800 [Candidatus Thermoplasmatota archaeon]